MEQLKKTKQHKIFLLQKRDIFSCRNKVRFLFAWENNTIFFLLLGRTKIGIREADREVPC